MNTIYLNEKEFAGLPEYSCSLPTGQTVGKRWRRNNNSSQLIGCPAGLTPDWYMGEYFMDETIPEGKIGIRWSKIVVGLPLKKVEQLPVHLL
jgi:hypothetical protein